MENTNKPRPMTPEEKQAFARSLGLVLGIFSKVLLKIGGCHVDYKINGENIDDIEKLHGLDISARLELAIKEERYEDAAQLKKLLDKKLGKGSSL